MSSIPCNYLAAPQAEPILVPQSDGLFEVALLGLKHQKPCIARLPSELQSAAAKISAKACDSEEAWFALVDLSKHFYRVQQRQELKSCASQDKAVVPRNRYVPAERAPIIAVRALEGVNERYVPPAVLDLLNYHRTDLSLWTALVMWLHARQLKVPVRDTSHFLDNFSNIGYSRHLHYGFFDYRAGFFSAQLDALGPYLLSDFDSLRLEEIRSEQRGEIKLSAPVGTPKWREQALKTFQYIKCKDEITTIIRQLISSPHHQLLLELLQQSLVCFCYWQGECLFDVLERYWLRLLISGYRTGSLVGTAAATAPAYSLSVELEHWLDQVVQSNMDGIGVNAVNKLKRRLPGSQCEQRILAVLRQILVVTVNGAERKLRFNRKALTVSAWTQIAKVLVIFRAQYKYVEIGCKPSEQRSHRLTSSEKLILHRLPCLIAPSLWFELLALERSGDDAQDAKLLFATVNQIFAWWKDVEQEDMAYLITRIYCELGPVFCETFLRECAQHRVVVCGVELIMCQLSYRELESFPLITHPKGMELFLQLHEADGFLMSDMCVVLEVLFKAEPLVGMGPMFSQFLVGVMIDPWLKLTAPKLLKNDDEFDWHSKKFYGLALALDHEVKAQVCARLQALCAGDREAANVSNAQLILRVFRYIDKLKAACNAA